MLCAGEMVSRHCPNSRFNSLLGVGWGIARFPLDAATNAGSLVTIGRFAGEYCLDGGAEITAGNRFVVAGTTVIQLTPIHQAPVTIEEIEIRSTSRSIGLRNFLRLVVTIRECEPEALCHFFELGRRIVRVPYRVIAADRYDA